MTGTQLRELRRRKGLTQAELARRLGISQAQVARLETGERRINRRLMIQLRVLFPEIGGK